MRRLLSQINWHAYKILTGVIMGRTLEPSDPALRSNRPPHETAAVLRMHRAGKPARQIMEILGYNRDSPRLMREMQRAMDQEQAAHEAGVPIHDAVIPKIGR